MKFSVLKSTLMRNNLIYFLRQAKSIFSKSFLFRQIVDIEKFAMLRPDAATILYCKPHVFHTSKVQFKQVDPAAAIIPFTRLKKYAVVLKDVQIIGGSGILILNRKFALYDPAALRHNKNLRLTDTGALYTSGSFCFIENLPANIQIREGIFLISHSSFNYYHFLCEVVARLAAIKELNISKDIPLIADRSCADIPQFMELLTMYNADQRPLVFVDLRKLYTIEKLYYTSLPNYITPGIKDLRRIQSEDALFDFNTLEFLRQKALQEITAMERPKRIFLSRKNASARRKFNEPSLFLALKPFGFEEYFPEEHGIRDQIAMFHAAEMIVGGCGAAFTNILFCNAGCKIICFINYPINLPTFSALAAFVGIDMVFLQDGSKLMTATATVHDPYIINETELIDTVKVLLGPSPA